jgi:hypothetical protein
MSRYDGFMNTISTSPGSTGFIVFYGDASAEGKNLLFIKYLTKSYPNQRKFDESRIKLVRGKNQDRLKIQFWIAPPGANAPKPDQEFSEPTFYGTTRYDVAQAEFHKSFGELKVFDDGFFDLGCNFPPNLSQFAKILRSNKNLTGYLVVYNSNKGQAKKILDYSVEGLVKNYKAPKNRLKTIYAGKDDDRRMEFWFVPAGKKPPAFSSK